MRVYVAGKDIPRAQAVMGVLRIAGHTIAFDWTNNYDDSATHLAGAERAAVQEADAIVYLWEGDQESARYETGMAMGLGKPVIVSRGHDSFFFHLPEVVSVQDDDKIMDAINKL